MDPLRLNFQQWAGGLSSLPLGRQDREQSKSNARAMFIIRSVRAQSF